MTETGRHPEFRNPPVTEAVLGLQFAPIPGFSPIYSGLFWQLIRSEFPKSELKDPIISSPAQLQDLSSILTRSWFISESGEYLLQIQSDRFLLNWRKVEDNRYPHYHTLRPRLANLWKIFVGFLEREDLVRPTVNRCEVTYVDHIEMGSKLDEVTPLASLFAFWSGGPTQWLYESTVAGFNIAVQMPNDDGQVHVQLSTGIRLKDAKPVIQLNFTTVRPITLQSDDAILSDLDMAQDLGVRAFLEFTSKGLQDSWGRVPE
jgi:uncharacterized protein (TIGR04255 family)